MEQEYEISEEGFPVKLPSGAPFLVLETSEVFYVTERVRQYTETYRWDNVSDVQDVDRIIIMELLVYRWGLWISRTKDYFGDDVDEAALRKSIKEYSGELRLVKSHLGMDKVTREKEQDESSVHLYLARIRQHAMEFGIMREEQCAKAIELAQTLIALHQLYLNCDEKERREQKCDAVDIIDWIGGVFRPQFQAIDEHFRNRPDGQKYWTGTL